MFMENTEELAQNKLLLLYLISKSEEPLDKNKITEFLLSRDYMNYFLIQQYLSELVKSELISNYKNDNQTFYKITNKGVIALSYFIERVPESFKRDVLSTFTKTTLELKKEKEIVSDYYQKENGLFVTNLKLVEKEDVLFSLYLDVADEEQAKIISNNWKKRPDKIFSKIINILLEE